MFDTPDQDASRNTLHFKTEKEGSYNRTKNDEMFHGICQQVESAGKVPKIPYVAKLRVAFSEASRGRAKITPIFRSSSLPARDQPSTGKRSAAQSYEGEPVVSPGLNNLFTPPAMDVGEEEDFEYDDDLTEDLIGSVRDEIEQLADQMSVATGYTDVDSTILFSNPQPRRSQAGALLSPDNIERSIENLAKKTERMTDTFRRFASRMEALEKENEILRGMVKRLVGSHQQGYIGDLLAAMEAMKLGITPDEQNGKIGGLDECKSVNKEKLIQQPVSGAVSSRRKMTTHVLLETLRMPGSNNLQKDGNENVENKHDVSNFNRHPDYIESQGTSFVVDLAEVMSIQSGHHGMLASLMDHHLEREANLAQSRGKEVNQNL